MFRSNSARSFDVLDVLVESVATGHETERRQWPTTPDPPIERHGGHAEPLRVAGSATS